MSSQQESAFCPYCKEAIKPGAVKCRYCGSELQVINPISSFSENDSFTFIKNALKQKYEIIEVIGKGGMASVYKARQKNLGRVVALKVIHPNLVHDQEFVQRFLKEAKVCALLSHPNIINIYDFGEIGGLYYISMEYLEGVDLAVMIKKQKRIRPARVMKYIPPIADALAYIHKKGLMHRDVKSSNIFITKEGRAVLMDFGIAFTEGSNLTVAGTLLGTPQFISPEQASGSKGSPSSDYYSLGIVLYECLTGSVPFNDPNPMVVINKIIKEIPAHPCKINKDIPAWLADVTMTLLSKDPGKRSVALKTLRNAYYNKPGTADRNRLNTPLFRGIDSSVVFKISLVSLLFLIFLGIILSIYMNISSKRPADVLQESAPETAASPSAVSADPLTLEAEQVRLPTSVQLIEEQMVIVEGKRVMQEFVSQRVWNMIMDGEQRGSNNAVTGIAFSNVDSFIKRLNAIPDNPYRYSLPSLELILALQNSGQVNIRRSEWVNDPPEFRVGYRPDMAKFFHHRFNDEAGERRNKGRKNIYFRLVRD